MPENIQRILWSLLPDRLDGSIDAESLSNSTEALTEGIALIAPPSPVLPGVTFDLKTESHEGLETDSNVGEASDLLHAFGLPDDIRAFGERLRSSATVGYVEIQDPPIPACGVRNGSSLGSTPDFTPHQGYLAAPPIGIGAFRAWRTPGGTAAGINIIDVEWGWNFGHEDLLRHSLGSIAGINRGDDHGTAVMGVMSGDNNQIGVAGVAFDAYCGGAAIGTPSGTWNTESAIHQAVTRLGPAGILVCELQTAQLLPAEVSLPVFKLFRWAIGRGIYVLAAAGNGGRSLDSLLPVAPESGSILVGAGSVGATGPPRERLRASNFGGRVNLHAWGETVASCGGLSSPPYADLQADAEPRRCYTRSFGGTSAATAIVAGAVACVAGAVRAAGRPPLSPSAMRALLIQTGSPQQGNASREPIGPQPNLPAALSALGL